MGVYTQFKDGFRMETTWGESLIVAAGSDAYIWGIYSKNCNHPSPTTTTLYGVPGVNEVESPDGTLTKGVFDLRGQYGIIPFNGILLWMAMGLSSTVGADPYTHTITPKAAVAGVLPPLPSFTIQHEMTGTATDWSTQYNGCKVTELILVCDYKSKALIFLVEVIGKGTEKVAYTLTNSPDFASGTTEAPYMFNSMSRKYDGSDLDGLIGMQLSIDNGIMAEHATTYDSVTDDYTGMWPQFFTEDNKKLYSLEIDYHPEASTIWEELIQATVTKDVIFKWTRSTNDYIQLTCKDCAVIGHTMISPKHGGEMRIDKVTIEFRSLETEVKDSIAGSFYGE